MKVVVLSRFADKSDFRIKYEKGQVVDFLKERADNLIVRNLVEEFKKEDKPKTTRKNADK